MLGLVPFEGIHSVDGPHAQAKQPAGGFTLDTHFGKGKQELRQLGVLEL